MTRVSVVPACLMLVALLQGCAHGQLFEAAQSYVAASQQVLPRVAQARTLAASVRTSLPKQPDPAASTAPIDEAVIAAGCGQAVGPVPDGDASFIELYAESLRTLATAPDDSFAALIGALQRDVPDAAGVNESVTARREAHTRDLATCFQYARALAPWSEQMRATTALAAADFVGEQSVKAAFELLKTLVAAVEAERRAQALRALVTDLQPFTDAAGPRLRARVATDLDLSMAGALWVAQQQRAGPAGTSPWPATAEAAQALRDFALAYRLREALLVDSAGTPGALAALEGLQRTLATAVREDRRLTFADLKAMREFVEAVREKAAGI